MSIRLDQCTSPYQLEAQISRPVQAQSKSSATLLLFLVFWKKILFFVCCWLHFKSWQWSCFTKKALRRQTLKRKKEKLFQKTETWSFLRCHFFLFRTKLLDFLLKPQSRLPTSSSIEALSLSLSCTHTHTHTHTHKLTRSTHALFRWLSTSLFRCCLKCKMAVSFSYRQTLHGWNFP